MNQLQIWEKLGPIAMVRHSPACGMNRETQRSEPRKLPRANGIEPHAYLSRLFAELPKATSVDH
jgi:hypothetical protein